jgi:hypothetical protein
MPSEANRGAQPWVNCREQEGYFAIRHRAVRRTIHVEAPLMVDGDRRLVGDASDEEQLLAFAVDAARPCQIARLFGGTRDCPD